jgi:hypothetical protein
VFQVGGAYFADHSLHRHYYGGDVMSDESAGAFRTVEQTAYYALFSDVIAEIEDCRIRAKASSETVDELLHLLDIGLTVLGLVGLEIVRQRKVGTLIFVETAAYALAH